MPNLVPGEGPPNAPIMLIGEAPGKTEDMLCRPFVGASGKLLESMLETVGLRRSDVYLTNVVKTRPANNDFSIFYDKKTPSPFLLSSIDELKQEMRSINPNVIIPLGTEALKALTGKTSISLWRGSVIPLDGFKIIPTFHPAHILRQYIHRSIAELDLKRAKKESLSKTFQRPVTDVIINPTFDQVISILSNLPDRLAFDIETLSTHVRCLGLSLSHTSAICIPFLSRKSQAFPTELTLPLSRPDEGSFQNHWTESEEETILNLIRKELPKRELIAQNFPFDTVYLARDLDIIIPGKSLFLDTMAGHHTAYSEFPKSLDFLTSIYTDLGYYADYNASSDKETWTYNCMDCIATIQSSVEIEKTLRDLDLWDYYQTYVHRPMLTLTKMGARGVRIDTKLQEKLASETKTRLDSVTITLSKNGQDSELNLSSPKQLQEFLYKDLSIPPQYITDFKTKQQRISTNNECLLRIQKTYPQHSDIIQQILDHRENSKLLSTFLTPKLNPLGRMETSFNITGTVTGRISSSATLSGYGGNLQQVPRSPIRKMFIPDEGYVWIKVDLSQAEARCVAWLAGIDYLIDRFTNDPTFDIHTWNASNVFRKPEKDIKKHERQIAKAGVHGGNYGLGPLKASKIYNMSFQDAKVSIEAYRKALPEIQKWWKKIDLQIKQTRSITTPLGRKRLFFDRIDDSTFRSGYSFIPQSIVCDVINLSLFLLDISLEPLGAFPILQVHDEIDFLSPTENLNEVINIISKTMVPKIFIPGVSTPLTIPIEISTGPNWWDQKEWEKDSSL